MTQTSFTGRYKDILLSIDEENKKCVDCGKENPTKGSVNNGVIICEECAEKHKQLGTMISYVVDINDEFDEYLLNYFTLGGNSKFEKFIKDENIDTSLPIESKYLTKAVDFYRKNLKHKVQGEHLLEKNYENPNEILEHPDNYFPEFENYQIKKDTHKTKVQQTKNMVGKISSNLFSFGKKMYSGMKQGAVYVGNKAAKGATYVAAKAQPAIKKGATFVGHQVGEAYTNIKKKIVHNKEGEKDKNAVENNNNEEKKVDDKKEENKKEDEKNNEEPKNDVNDIQETNRPLGAEEQGVKEGENNL